MSSTLLTVPRRSVLHLVAAESQFCNRSSVSDDVAMIHQRLGSQLVLVTGNYWVSVTADKK